MSKNGKLFISMIDSDQFLPSVWDPYSYRQNHASQTLSDFAEIHKITNSTGKNRPSPFQPIEYKDIPHGNYLSFTLERNSACSRPKLPTVGEQELLFGTMRAYLGNILVTPMAEWLNHLSPLHFFIKSEFVVVSPHDKLFYFWFSYMRSKTFLQNLPIGTGGTRPRLEADVLGKTPVTIPALEMRTQINHQLKLFAQEEWTSCLKIEAMMDFMSAQSETDTW